MIPGECFVRDLVHRLRFFRSLDPLPADGRLPFIVQEAKPATVVQLRDYLLSWSATPSAYPRASFLIKMRHDLRLNGKCFAPESASRAGWESYSASTNPAMTMR